jgi:hypothetical protein
VLIRQEQKAKKQKKRQNTKGEKTKDPNADVGGSGGRAIGRTGRQTKSP